MQKERKGEARRSLEGGLQKRSGGSSAKTRGGGRKQTDTIDGEGIRDNSNKKFRKI